MFNLYDASDLNNNFIIIKYYKKMTKKNLIIFMPSVEGGGVEKNFFLVSNYLSKYINNIFIITSDRSIKNKLNKKIKLITPQSKFWANKGRLMKYFICLIYLLKFFLNHKNNLVFSFQANAYAIILCKVFNTKIISRSNSSSIGWSKNIFKNLLYRLILGLSNQVIVNSHDFKKELDKKFSIKSEVILNPLNKKQVIINSKKKINLDFYKTKELKIINVGRLVDQKDHMTLLYAANLLKNTMNFKLLIIGRGQNKKKISEFIKENNLNKMVKIIPFQKNPLKFMRMSDLFILTSKFEGLPNVLLEAQCLKKYIISTNCPTGPREILLNGKAGDLVKVSDFKSISKKIIEFKKNKKSNKQKINLGYKKINRFEYNVNMQKYLFLVYKFMKF